MSSLQETKSGGYATVTNEITIRRASTGVNDPSSLLGQNMGPDENSAFFAQLTTKLNGVRFPRSIEVHDLPGTAKGDPKETPYKGKKKARSTQRSRGATISQPTRAEIEQNWRSGSNDPQNQKDVIGPSTSHSNEDEGSSNRQNRVSSLKQRKSGAKKQIF